MGLPLHLRYALPTQILQNLIYIRFGGKVCNTDLKDSIHQHQLRAYCAINGNGAPAYNLKGLVK